MAEYLLDVQEVESVSAVLVVVSVKYRCGCAAKIVGRHMAEIGLLSCGCD